jgi:hypothetical protein
VFAALRIVIDMAGIEGTDKHNTGASPFLKTSFRFGPKFLHQTLQVTRKSTIFPLQLTFTSYLTTLLLPSHLWSQQLPNPPKPGPWHKPPLTASKARKISSKRNRHTDSTAAIL